MRLLACVLLFAASTAEAAPYDDLFDTSATWRYREERRVWFGGDVSKAKVETVVVVCRVASVKKLAGAKVSTIECDEGTYGSTAIAGTWVMTKRGMWRANEGAATARDVRRVIREPVLIAARPRVKATKLRDDEVTGSAFSIERDGNAWCAIEDYGDPGGGSSTRMCFEDGAIISKAVSGEWYSEGGGGSTTTATLVP